MTGQPSKLDSSSLMEQCVCVCVFCLCLVCMCMCPEDSVGNGLFFFFFSSFFHSKAGVCGGSLWRENGFYLSGL